MTRAVHCTSHCSACGSCFKSLEAFDLHRAGDYATGRYCRELDEHEGLAVVSDDGVCAMYDPTRYGVVVWTSARSIGRAGEAFPKGPTEAPSELGAKRLTPAQPLPRVIPRMAA